MEIDETLKERGQTHGKFDSQFELATALKMAVTDSCVKWNRGTVTVRKDYPMSEAMDMILTKVSRIAVGNPMEQDHWKDIAGYATLMVQYLRGEAVEEESEDEDG